MNTTKLKNFIYRNICPLCGSKAIKFIDYINAPNPTLFGTTQVNFINKIELFKCEKCDSLFNNKIISEKKSVALYEKTEGNKWSVNSFEDDKTSDLIHIVKKYFTRGSKILDVGCNEGALLDYAASFGIDTYGIEYSNLAVKQCKKRGHKVYKNFTELGIENKFDAIFAFDLMEHLYDTKSFFSCVENLLNVNGVLMILTGNPDYFLAKLFRGRWWYFALPEHIVFPSKKFFSSQTKFKMIDYIKLYNSKKYFLNYIFHIDKQILKKIMILIISFLRNRYYYNFPLIGKDHALVILKKYEI